MVLGIVCPVGEAADATILLAGLSADLGSFSALCMLGARLQGCSETWHCRLFGVAYPICHVE